MKRPERVESQFSVVDKTAAGRGGGGHALKSPLPYATIHYVRLHMKISKKRRNKQICCYVTLCI